MVNRPRNIAASVRQRLLNLAQKEGQAFHVVLVAFGLERFLYRLSVSVHRDRFVLKGDMLVTLWTKDSGRFTQDIDFMSFRADDEVTLKKTIMEILAIDAGDGLVFDDASLTAAPIQENQVYGPNGSKVYLSGRRITSKIDRHNSYSTLPSCLHTGSEARSAIRRIARLC